MTEQYPCNNCKTAEAFKGMPVSCRDLCKEWEKWQGAKVTCPECGKEMK